MGVQDGQDGACHHSSCQRRCHRFRQVEVGRNCGAKRSSFLGKDLEHDHWNEIENYQTRFDKTYGIWAWEKLRRFKLRSIQRQIMACFLQLRWCWRHRVRATQGAAKSCSKDYNQRFLEGEWQQGECCQSYGGCQPKASTASSSSDPSSSPTKAGQRYFSAFTIFKRVLRERLLWGSQKEVKQLQREDWNYSEHSGCHPTETEAGARAEIDPTNYRRKATYSNENRAAYQGCWANQEHFRHASWIHSLLEQASWQDAHQRSVRNIRF